MDPSENPGLAPLTADSSITVDQRAGSQSHSQTPASARMRQNRRGGKDMAKPKASGEPGATRFQCLRCPKNFSRIENLTRHQANHDEVGKFACNVCRKRFTRSDLLNRHRRIHGPQDTPEAHVTPSDFNSLVERRPMAQAAPSYSTANASAYQSHMPQQPLYQPQNSAIGHPEQDAYQQQLQQHNATSSSMHPAQGLTSLMEAALAPPISQQTFSFAPVGNDNPLLWDGFMPFSDSTGSYMGAYDADMSWTLDYLPAEGSPSYLSDHDMIGGFEEYGHYDFQAPVQPRYSQASTEPEEAEGDEDDANDWPDKVKQPLSPLKPPRVSVQMQPISWQAAYDEARSSGLTPTSISPVQVIDAALRDNLLSTLNSGTFGRDGGADISTVIFPPAEVLDFFIRLYVRYIQPRFPILHLPTFDLYRTPSTLLLAMMFLGSSHSRADCGRFSRLFHERLRVLIIRLQEIDQNYMRDIDNILTYFLLCLAGTWSGSKHAYEFAEGGRGILATACRRTRLLDCRPSSRVDDGNQRPGASSLDSVWLAWVESEKRKRLGLAIYCFDCQYPALFNNQPYVSKAETTNCVFPCPEEYWVSPSADAWKMLVGTADTPPSTYYLHALNCVLLRKWVKPAPPIAKTNEWGKIVLMYALHTHIFEWRQSVSMLNPTGLRGTFGNSAHDMGEGLRERRRWLVDGLDSFGECYLGPGSSVAASLLHHLGYISLNVSLSDMHLVAGRSVHQHDSNFAEENLKHWANSELSDSTMSHVYQILEISHQNISAGLGADSSYEIAVALFTGGIICWTYAKLRVNAPKGQYIEEVRRASSALRQMGCWRMCSMFGRILNGFEVPKMAPAP